MRSPGISLTDGRVPADLGIVPYIRTHIHDNSYFLLYLYMCSNYQHGHHIRYRPVLSDVKVALPHRGTAPGHGPAPRRRPARKGHGAVNLYNKSRSGAVCGPPEGLPAPGSYSFPAPRPTGRPRLPLGGPSSRSGTRQRYPRRCRILSPGNRAGGWGRARRRRSGRRHVGRPGQVGTARLHRRWTSGPAHPVPRRSRPQALAGARQGAGISGNGQGWLLPHDTTH
jgi:hypothetical protein